MTAPPPLLGVTRSLTGRVWTGPTPAQDRAAQALAQRIGSAIGFCLGKGVNFLGSKNRALSRAHSTSVCL